MYKIFLTEFVSSESQYTNKPEGPVVTGNDVVKISVTQHPSDENASSDSTLIIVGVLIGVIALLVILLAALCYRQRRLRKTMVSLLVVLLAFRS